MTGAERDTSGEALRRALLAVKDMKARVEAAERRAHEPIAIIGMACRFPGGANTPEAYWDLLRSGRDALGLVPQDRWDHEALFDPDPEAVGKIYTDQGGFVDWKVDQFDASFFGIAPIEARSMDPQQRLLLEVTWEALERASIAPDRLAGSMTGMFVGISTSDYANLKMRSDRAAIGPYDGTGVAASVAAGRLSYVLGLRGPAVALDTACSSSLVAMSLAVQSLQSGACRVAITGGVNLMLEPQAMIFLSRFRALSPTGRCHTFGSGADGYVRGEGCGMLVLKRLSDAEADGDRIIAVVRSAAVNHDGRSSGLTVPSGAAQREVMERALTDAGLLPSEVDFVEAHGTGTHLGDPIEVRALDAVYSNGRAADMPLMLGSAKAIIGHLEAAAGIAGVIKAILALENEAIPAQLHCDELSEHIDWSHMSVDVVRDVRPWARGARARRVGVSAFGFSGTNAHVIIEEAPPRRVRSFDEARPLVIAMSARSPDALSQLADATAEALQQLVEAPQSELAFSDVAWTLQEGRARFAYRLAVTASTPGEAAALLRVRGADNGAAGISSSTVAGPPKVAFVFTGQGAQLPNMGRTLYHHEPVFRSVMDQCDAVLRPLLPRGLLDVLHADDDATASLIHHTGYTQPAMFALQCGLVALWRSWGVEPVAVAGHSIGEYAAAVTAGIMDLDDAAALIATRGRLMSALAPGGRMVAVFADEEQVSEIIGAFRQSVSVAASNGPSNIVISGAGDSIAKIVALLDERHIRHRSLEVSHAFHSPLMASVVPEFALDAAAVSLLEPRITMISSVTGGVERALLTTPAYWSNQVLAPVRFDAAVASMLSFGIDQFVEIGPQPTLLGLVGRITGSQRGLHASLRPSRVAAAGQPRRGEREQLADALGSVWAAGVEPDWVAIDGGRSQSVPAPTYPFQRHRYWWAEDENSDGEGSNEQRARRPQQRAIVARDVIHPLVHRRVDSPAIIGHVFTAEIDAIQSDYLADHRIFGAPLMPATGYLEAALVAGRTAFGDHVTLAQVSLHEMLVLPEAEPIELQVIIGEPSNGRSQFGVHSRIGGLWKRHASGVVDLAAHAHDRPKLSTATAIAPVDLDAQYRALDERGVSYGPAFRTLVASERGDRWATGRLALSPHQRAAAGDYLAHPALLDGCLQLLAAALHDEADDESVFLPVGVGNYEVLGPVGSEANAVLVVHRDAVAPSDVLTADIQVYSPDGRLVVVLGGLKLRRVDPRSIKQARRQMLSPSMVEGSLYEVGWVRTPPLDQTPMRAGRWLVISGNSGDADDGVGGAVAAELGKRGAQVVVADDADTAFGSGASGASEEWAGVVMVVGSDPESTPFSILGGQRQPIVDYLTSAQALLRGDGSLAEGARLWLITTNAQSVNLQADPVDLRQAPLWGMAQALSAEEPGLRVGCIDLPARSALDARRLVDELTCGAAEDRVAFRDDHRLVPRLVARHDDQSITVPSARYALDVTERGTLDGMVLVAAEPLVPHDGHVVIEVRASGLNFRDVLNVMGMYPGAVGLPGSELSGVVTAVGAGVASVIVGDEVIALVDGSFRREAMARADMVFKLPASMDFTQGAALPIAFLTAHYGLHHLGAIGSHSTVLVHAAAGGVGMAAVQIALAAGATIIGTAGSAEKRSFLRSIGVQHVFDSRSLDFAAEVMDVTDGRGVDIALNSLADGFIPATLGVMTDSGTFLEIGKRGIWSSQQVADRHPNIRYHAYDLADVLRDDMALIRTMMDAVLTAMSTGSMQPMPTRMFALHDIRSAFRFMAMARHVGKVVVLQRAALSAESVEAGLLFDGNGSHLVSGGLGGLGLEAAQSLVRRGARHIGLVGRRPASTEALVVIDELRSAGAQVEVFQADIADAAQLDAVLTSVRSTMGPLRGVIHAAGVLDDGVVRQMNWSQFQSVFDPKVGGAWNLHRATRQDRLSYFVMYSSAASLLGSRGQCNYAAANAFLDALAHHRQAVGLPATSVNWGGWSQVGMAARLGKAQQGRLDRSGVGLIDPVLGDEALGMLLQVSAAQVGVLCMDWAKLTAHLVGASPPFLEQVLGQPSATGRGGERSVGARSIVEDLEALAPADRFGAVLDHIRTSIVSVLGLDSTTSLDSGYGLQDLGMDSLMAVELANRLQRSTGVALAPTAAFEHPTLNELTVHVAAELTARMGSADVLANVVVTDADKTREDIAIGPIVARPRATHVGASAAQQRLLFLEELYPDLPLYNLAFAVKLVGVLDMVALEVALTEVVRRHQSLRTDFDIVDGAYSQVVTDPAPFDLPVIDLRSVPPDRRGAALHATLGDEARRRFALHRGYKLRSLVVALDVDTHVLVTTFHHIAADGWSVARFYTELAALYADALSGIDGSLPELSIQYNDYSAWLDEQQDSPRVRDQLRYWTQRLGGELAVLALPLDRLRPPTRSYAGGLVRFEIDPAVMAQVRAFSRSAGVTPFVLLMSTYMATLARWSGQDDIIVGTAAANRGRPETAELIGLFANTLAIRAAVDLGAPFTSLLDEVKQNVLGAFMHQEVSFNRIVEAVKPARDLTRTPVFQTMFVYNNMPMPDVRLAQLAGERIDLWSGCSEYDLSLAITEASDATLATMEFNAEVFDSDTVERFVAQWRTLLDAAMADPSLVVGQLPLLSVAERLVLLDTWGTSVGSIISSPTSSSSNRSTGALGGQRIHNLFAQQVLRSPHALAVRCGDQTLSFAALDERSDVLAQCLNAMGIEAGDVVGIAVQRSVDMVVALLGVLKAGAAYLPLDPGFPPDRLSFMVADAGVRVVLVSDSALSDRVDVSSLTLLDVVASWSDITRLAAAWVKPPEPVDHRGADALAYVIYTSGSTGVPKGVEIGHAAVVNFLISMRNQPGLHPGDVLLAVTTLSFDISVLELFLPLVSGAQLVVASNDDVGDGARLVDLIQSSGTTVMQATPTTWSMLVASGWSGGAGLRALCGGEAMSMELAERLLSRCASVWNMFGPTETTIWSTTFEVTVQSLAGRTVVPIGRPIANTVCRILDPAGSPVPVGVAGELWIGGSGVAWGYHGRPDLTAARFVPDPFGPGRLYRTGDRARWCPDANVEFLGRLDTQVKVRGHRIELGEVESGLRLHPAVRDAVVVAEGADASARLIAYVIAADSEDVASASVLRAWLSDRVPNYMVPSLFIAIDAFPLTPNAKVDRNALPRPDAVRSLVADALVEPRNDVERVVADTMAATLQIDQVGVTDNFFELGGHSLLATSLLARLATIFGIAIELRGFFFEPTVASVAAMLLNDDATRSRIERVAQIQARLNRLSPEAIAAMLAAKRASSDS